MVHMTTKNHPNNERLRALIDQAGLTQVEALTLFNRGLIKPYSVSAWKAYLADAGATRWRRFDEHLLAHAEKVFARVKI
jgi:hypothetical protein